MIAPLSCMMSHTLTREALREGTSQELTTVFSHLSVLSLVTGPHSAICHLRSGCTTEASEQQVLSEPYQMLQSLPTTCG